jgi:hypothetical protein
VINRRASLERAENTAGVSYFRKGCQQKLQKRPVLTDRATQKRRRLGRRILAKLGEIM